MNIVAARTSVDQTVHKPRVRVEVEDNWPVIGKQSSPLSIRQSMGVVIVVNQLEEINHVDTSNLELWEVLEQQIDGGERLASCDISAAGHDYVGLHTIIGTELRPDAATLGAVLDSFVHGKILQMILLIGHDNIDIVL